jgi:hypothetical protein
MRILPINPLYGFAGMNEKDWSKRSTIFLICVRWKYVRFHVSASFLHGLPLSYSTCTIRTYMYTVQCTEIYSIYGTTYVGAIEYVIHVLADILVHCTRKALRYSCMRSFGLNLCQMNPLLVDPLNNFDFGFRIHWDIQIKGYVEFRQTHVL